MRVLVVSHTGVVGGAEHSLLRFLAAARDRVEIAVATPPGPLADRVRALGVPVLPLRGTSGSLRLHPVHTVRALGELADMALQTRRHARRWRADLVHANTIRAGIVAVAARALGAPPALVHVRDVLPPTPLTRALRRVLRFGSAGTIAISRHVARAWAGRDDAPDVHLVMELVDPGMFAPACADTAAAARARLGVAPGAEVLAVVAQITPWKGQDVAVEALARVRAQRAGAELLIVGDTLFVAGATRYDNRTYERRLRARAAELGVADAVRFVGARDDVPAVLAATDVVLVPSWDEPFGLAVIEAMSMERAVVATAVGGPAEVITDGADGRLAPPREPQAWADAATALLADAESRTRMGAAARRTVLERFAPERYVEAMLAAYAAVAGAGSRVNF